MPDVPTFDFRCEYLALPDADDRPLGTSAALFLSALCSLAEGAKDTEWFALSPKEGELLTGFSHDTQKRLRERLMAAGYIRYRFKGQGGQLQYLVCTQNAYKGVSTQNAYKPREEGELTGVSTQNAYKAGVVCTHFAYKGEERPPSSPPPLPSPDPISPLPPIIPPAEGETGIREKKGAGRKPDDTDEQAKVLLAAFRMVRFPTDKHFTASDWQAYRTNLRLLVQDGYTPEQVRTATQNALSRWGNREMVNPRSVARHITALLEPISRGSPAGKNGHSSVNGSSMKDKADLFMLEYEDS